MNLRRFIILLFSLNLIYLCHAIPAHPGIKTVIQPDGSKVTIALHGDEYLNYTTTSDGYTVVKNDGGYYVYAQKEAGKIVPGNVVAHDISDRTLEEEKFVSALGKGIYPEMTSEMKLAREYATSDRRMARAQRAGTRYDYSKFRGLIILVEYNDCEFSRDDFMEVWSDMTMKKDFTGYMSAGRRPEWVECTGSVFDYYYDNSMGKFEANFDIVGPVKVNRSMYFVNQASNSILLINDVLTATDPIVNFSDYDTDGDGIIDMVYFIFAGPGSHYTGNDQRLLWPHSANYANFTSKYMDGVKMGRFACSVELSGSPDDNRLEGIGTICHEFSHVLGLEDFYDTDGFGSGGSSEMTPELWSIMDAGCYIDDSKTPCGFSIYERYCVGFAEPEIITETGDYTLEALDTSNKGYQLPSGKENEFFMLENRQKIKWNKVNPGHGLVVFKVDRSNENAWIGNYINCDPEHNYYQLLRATNEKYDYTGTPYPGTGNHTILSNTTIPSLKSWNGRSAPLVLSRISESEDGTINFSVVNDGEESEMSGIETIENSQDRKREIYDLAGRRINGNPERAGIYIVRSGSEVKKIVITGK